MLPELTVLCSNKRHGFIWLLPNRSRGNRVSDSRCQREDAKQRLSRLRGAGHSCSFPSLKMGLCVRREERLGEKHALLKQSECIYHLK